MPSSACKKKHAWRGRPAPRPPRGRPAPRRPRASRCAARPPRAERGPARPGGLGSVAPPRSLPFSRTATPPPPTSTLSLHDALPIYALDAWGGWTFAASVRALQEDPWQRLRAHLLL